MQLNCYFVFHLFSFSNASDVFPGSALPMGAGILKLGHCNVTRVCDPAAAGWGGWNTGQPRGAETEAADASLRPLSLENVYLPGIDRYLGERSEERRVGKEC